MGVCVFESADFSFYFLLELNDKFACIDDNNKGISLAGYMSIESDGRHSEVGAKGGVRRFGKKKRWERRKITWCERDATRKQN